ncbi:MAG: YicC family protein [Thiomargarita sp.]|nr:YicC family protein [Thiomargarita sp.]
MPCSMTAFARLDVNENQGQICWEIRSVNHRYLDINIRLPEEFRALEMVLREQLKKKLKRGKVDCTLYFKANQDNKWTVNQNLVQQLYQAIQQVNTITKQTSELNALDILHWQGVLERGKIDVEAIKEIVLQQFNTAITQLIEHREREGSKLADLIKQRCQTIAEIVVTIRDELPTILVAQRERLQARVTELIDLNNERLEQEITLLMYKMDVAEELDRLETHLIEIERTLEKNEQAIGRRLDFLIQELHREANTLGAKSNHIKTTQNALELKVLIEQIREQVQNIE